jgi:hypothetical protein
MANSELELGLPCRLRQAKINSTASHRGWTMVMEQPVPEGPEAKIGEEGHHFG